jgi:hypothetical protein
VPARPIGHERVVLDRVDRDPPRRDWVDRDPPRGVEGPRRQRASAAGGDRRRARSPARRASSACISPRRAPRDGAARRLPCSLASGRWGTADEAGQQRGKTSGRGEQGCWQHSSCAQWAKGLLAPPLVPRPTLAAIAAARTGRSVPPSWRRRVNGAAQRAWCDSAAIATLAASAALASLGMVELERHLAAK